MDFQGIARVSNNAKMSRPLAGVNQSGVCAPLAHLSTWISLVGLRPRIARLRFSRHYYANGSTPQFSMTIGHPSNA
jgi:hypothetical protein